MQWRRAIGNIPGAKEINYRAEIGRGGSPVNVQLTGNDFDRLKSAAQIIKDQLGSYSGIEDITDSFESGKQEVMLEIKPEAEQLGLTLSSLASQVRQAFFGFEVQTIQRDRDDVRVVVRYPLNERQSLDNSANHDDSYTRWQQCSFCRSGKCHFGSWLCHYQAR